jgi:hypothetical protein
MIRQQVGDVLEINYEGNWFYVIVLTKIAMFGGNIVFAFHNDGLKMELEELLELEDGFNICTDLILPKREDRVRRIGKVEETKKYFKTVYMKGTWTHKPGEKAKQWFIYHIDDLRNSVTRVRRLSKKFKKAMDYATYPFDLVSNKILERYTPDKDDRI